MAGIYLHIPFCKKACYYCDFHFSTSLQTKDAVLEAMLKEIKERKEELGSEEIQSIYFGGGTPSILEVSELKSLIEEIKIRYNCGSLKEITLEANPDDLSFKKLSDLKSAGINRLSIGIQSFQEEVLTMMNRSHNVNQALQCVSDAQELGFANITVDLIYGIPGMTMDEWKHNVQQVISMNIQHVSAYCLTIEERTVFAHKQKKGELVLPSDDEVFAQYQYLTQSLGELGFDHYEISNFGREGFYSLHNSSYWKKSKYLGLGPAAHSYDGSRRRWNISNNALYAKKLIDGADYFEKEELSNIDRYNESLMTGLRTIWGVDTEELKKEYSIDLLAEHGDYLNSLIQSGDVIKEGSRIKLSEKAWIVSDAICSELFKIEE